MVNADDGLASNRSGEHHSAARRRQDRLTRLGNNINPAVTRCPRDRWRSESSLHHGCPAERPAGGRGQRRSGHSRSRNGEHAHANRYEDGYTQVSTQYLSCSGNRAVFNCSLPLAAMFAGLLPSSSELA